MADEVIVQFDKYRCTFHKYLPHGGNYIMVSKPHWYRECTRCSECAFYYFVKEYREKGYSLQELEET
jgi:hypothetical protein